MQKKKNKKIQENTRSLKDATRFADLKICPYKTINKVSNDLFNCKKFALKKLNKIV